jgi:YVTN family beta-propeller protein
MGRCNLLKILLLIATFLLGLAAADTEAAKKKKKKKPAEDQYAQYVWPPPPDEARIRLVDILTERTDVEAKSKLARSLLLGATKGRQYEKLKQPFGVAIDSKERIIVSDPALAAIIRFDRAGRAMDVLGTTGAVTLKTPLGVFVSPDDTIYVADAGAAAVVAYDEGGQFVAMYGQGDLQNPTDMTLSPDGAFLYVTDSKAHKVVVFDVETKNVTYVIGRRGNGEGEFNFPSALIFDQDGNLMVLDQANARVQVLTQDGEFLDEFGGRGTGFGQFTRPKDLALHSSGVILATDAAFNNVQIFDVDYALLTFVGEGGGGPGQFSGAAGVAIRGNLFAVVDQLGGRVQVFRFLFE